MRKILYGIYLVFGVIIFFLGYHFYISPVTRENISREYLTGEGASGSAPPKAAAAEEGSRKTSGLRFRNEHLLKDHFSRHGRAMGFSSPKEYERAARGVVQNPAALHKIQKKDGDDVYYLESGNDFVVVSADGYIRTYFRPNNGIRYFNKQ
ncbi:hypothetical protein [Succinimonas amylolytica]|uniref:hypothetical protein n=1 Tax=Succinimonas amylolytica TaxID=83769 RepID=UPI000360AF63|nr:hypothetical protein [Succinimonas amylolytica]